MIRRRSREALSYTAGGAHGASAAMIGQAADDAEGVKAEITDQLQESVEGTGQIRSLGQAADDRQRR